MASNAVLQEDYVDKPERAAPPVPDVETPVAGEEEDPKLEEDRLELSGYVCEFVEPPPAFLQFECPICLDVLREPHLISCCGNKFCKECINRIVFASKPCPVCVKVKYDVVPEKSLQRALNDLKVFCGRKKDGCEWIGELRDFDGHLNIQPEDKEKRLDGCGLVVLKCSHCEYDFLRKDLQEHEEGECMKRPYSCDYCNDYMATFEEVVYVHYEQCKCYPMPCPNKCDSSYAIARKDLDKHIADDCPLTVIKCDAGCDVQMKREDMPAHLSENPIKHILYLASEVKEQNKMLTVLCQDHAVLRQDHAVLRQDYAVLHQQHADLHQQHADLHQQHAVLRQELAYAVPPCKFLVSKARLQQEDAWTSAPFCSHPGGYKLCLKVWPFGCGEGKGTHVSFSLHLMRGEFDDHLKWPFRAFVTVEIVNPKFFGIRGTARMGNYHHCTTFSFELPRVAESDMDEDGVMAERFVPRKTALQHIVNDEGLANGLWIRVSNLEECLCKEET